MKTVLLHRSAAKCVAFVSLICVTAYADTEIVQGFNASVKEIRGPDDLNLDPTSVLIAVDSFGDQDREVNGVLFQSDKPDDGTVKNETSGVGVRTSASNRIDNWAEAPRFEGGTGNSAQNLAQIMRDIRWEAAPRPVTVEIAGLDVPRVEVQILLNEGADRNRRWDIGLGEEEEDLIFDDVTSEGHSDDGVWTPDNSFVVTFEADVPEGGTLEIVMRQHIGGQDPPGGDNNPIIQGLIVHRIGGGKLFQITEVTKSVAGVMLTWESLPGVEYTIQYNRGLTDPSWIELDDGVPSAGEQTSYTDQGQSRTSLPEGFYRVVGGGKGGPRETVPVKLLTSFLPSKADGYERNQEGFINSDDDNAVEVNASFINEFKGIINVSIADMVNYPNLYENFLSGCGLYQSTAGNNLGLETDQEFDIPDPDNAGFSLHQSTWYGVLEIAQATGEMLFNTAQGSFVYTDGQTVSFEKGSQVDAAIAQQIIDKAGGVEGLEQFIQATALNLGPTQGPRGSLFGPYSRDVDADVAGWVMFDQEAGVGMMLLGISNRFAVIIEGNELDDMTPLLAVEEGMDFVGLEKLAVIR